MGFETTEKQQRHLPCSSQNYSVSPVPSYKNNSTATDSCKSNSPKAHPLSPPDIHHPQQIPRLSSPLSTSSSSLSSPKSLSQSSKTMAKTVTQASLPRYSLPSVPRRSYDTPASAPVYTNYAPPPLCRRGAGRSYAMNDNSTSKTATHIKKRGRYHYTSEEGSNTITKTQIPQYQGYELPARVTNLSSSSSSSSSSDASDLEDEDLANNSIGIGKNGSIIGKYELTNEAKKKIKKYEEKLWLAQRCPVLALDIPKIEKRIGSIYFHFGHLDQPLAQNYLKYRRKKRQQRNKRKYYAN